MFNKKIYRGRYVNRIRIHARIPPEIYYMFEWLAKKYFPCRKKYSSLMLQLLIVEKYLEENREIDTRSKAKYERYLRKLKNICTDQV